VLRGRAPVALCEADGCTSTPECGTLSSRAHESMAKELRDLVLGMSMKIGEKNGFGEEGTHYNL
jgi:hypothetical protein